MTKDQEPSEQQIKDAFYGFYQTIKSLRHPVTGCPWDLEQDHKSLRRFMIEEAYEASEAMDGEAFSEICGELGDVLLQVVLNAQVAADDKQFHVVDVIEAINAKMLRRHPHVFGSEEDKKYRSVDQIKQKWQEIKKAERTIQAAEKTLYEREMVHKVHPATRKALEIGKVANRIDFDWGGIRPVFDKLVSEVKELEDELVSIKDMTKVSAELGDVYFTLAQLCRHLGLDPEVVAEDGNRKFLRRFANMEMLMKADGRSVESAKQKELETYWLRAKAQEM